MTIETRTCFTVICDGCGVPMEFDECLVHFDSAAEVERYLPGGEYGYDEGWTVSDGKHRCPDCPPLEPSQADLDDLARRPGPGDVPLEGLATS